MGLKNTAVENSVAPPECVVSKLSYSILPTPRIDRAIRKRYSGRRVSPGVAVYTTAAIENILIEIIRASKVEATASKKKRINMHNLVAAIRTHPSLSRLFRSYAFSSGGSKLAYKSINLMTKLDREVVGKVREEKTAQNQEKVVPAVDEK